MAEEYTEKFDELYWSYNCPLQMWQCGDGTWRVINYMPRKERIVTLDERVTREELPSFCEKAARTLRNLADLFDALGDGKINTIYYPDEKVEDAILSREEKKQIDKKGEKR